jgi:hemoglobin
MNIVLLTEMRLGVSQSEEAIFDQLGGVEGVRSLIDDFYRRVLGDESLAHFFEKTDMDRLRKMQFEFIASALGGPIQYSGSELTAVHAGRGITNQHYAKFAGHLATAMEDRGVSPALVDAMLGRLATFRDKVVGGPTSDG